MKISEIKSNPNNPRLIKEEKFRKLVKSIKDFPEMMELRPIVIDENNVIQGGNMRYQALLDLKYKEIPDSWVKQGKDLSEDQWKQFVIKDNVGFGEWEWDTLANEWDALELAEWGLDVWQTPVEIDYSILDGEDLSKELGDMTNGVKKAIQIEFEAEHYEEASELVKYWRRQTLYIGGFLMEKLKQEKEKL